MHEGLHLTAVALTAVAAGAHPGWARLSAAGDLAAALVMLAAMVDVMYLRVVSAPVWSIALFVTAMGMAAVASPRARRPRGHAAASCAVPHSALGLVATAALLPLMHPASTAEVSAHAGHGGAGMGMLIAVVLAAALAHVSACLLASVREARARGRAPHALMGAATGLMAAAVLV